MKLKKNIAVSESGFIFNPGNGDSFSVNEIGAEIIHLMQENKSVAEISEEISAKYEVVRPGVEKDLDDFISLLFSYNLLEQ
jgi:hypothetical protein